MNICYKEFLFTLILLLKYSLQQFSTDFPPLNFRAIGELTFRWKKTKTGKVNFLVEKKTPGFGAIGLGKQVMAGSNIIFFDKTGDNGDGITIRDCKVLFHSLPKDCRPGIGSWEIVHSTADQNSFKIEISRDITDSDDATYDFVNEYVDFIWTQGLTNIMGRWHGKKDRGFGSFAWPEEKNENEGRFSEDFPEFSQMTLGDMKVKWKKRN